MQPSGTSGEATRPSEDEQIAEIIANAWNSKVTRAGIPQRYREAECDLGSKMYENAARAGVGAFLHGPTGTGKTYAACAAVLKALKSGRDARYITTHELLGKMKDEFGEEKWVSKQITSAWLLVLDEAGEGDDSKWDVAALFDLINRRYDEMLPTIICSNYTIPELMNMWGVEGVKMHRILSRLSEMCVFKSLEGEDRRLHGQAAG